MPTIAQEFAVLAAGFVETFGGSGGGAQVTLNRRARGTYSAAGMSRDQVEAITTHTAVRSMLEQQTITAGGGSAGVESVFYTFTAADLAGVPPDAEDTITDPNITEGGDPKKYRIVSVNRECGDTLFRCFCRSDRGGQ